jgi:UTP-glucose-1-phosphate uridylyltransferase
MEDITFNSVKELYERLKPALKTKCSEMHRNSFTYIKEEDIWNYLKEIKWKKASNLGLHEMVSDVLNSEDILIDSYLKEKLNTQKRTLYFDSEVNNEENN